MENQTDTTTEASETTSTSETLIPAIEDDTSEAEISSAGPLADDQSVEDSLAEERAGTYDS